jgi:hypothetical protein
VSQSQPTPNPKRVAAGRLNRLKRGPITTEGRERLRQAALAHQPWQHSTGPCTAAGKVKAAVNGKRRQTSEHSVREARRSLAEFTTLAHGLSQARRLIAELLHGAD